MANRTNQEIKFIFTIRPSGLDANFKSYCFLRCIFFIYVCVQQKVARYSSFFMHLRVPLIAFVQQWMNVSNEVDKYMRCINGKI